MRDIIGGEGGEQGTSSTGDEGFCGSGNGVVVEEGNTIQHALLVCHPCNEEVEEEVDEVVEEEVFAGKTPTASPSASQTASLIASRRQLRPTASPTAVPTSSASTVPSALPLLSPRPYRLRSPQLPRRGGEEKVGWKKHELDGGKVKWGRV